MVPTVVKRLSMLSAVGTSTVFAAYDAWLLLRGLAPTGGLFFIHRFILYALLATWVVADAEQSHRARPTFDYGALVLFLFALYVPYYLITTRRRRGLLVLGGVGLLFLLPQFAEVIAAYVS